MYFLLHQAVRLSVADQLPDEPAANCSQPLATIRFRAPEGKVLVRRFLASNSLQILLNYVTSQGYHTTEFKVLTTFPRKDVSINANERQWDRNKETSVTFDLENSYAGKITLLQKNFSGHSIFRQNLFPKKSFSRSCIHLPCSWRYIRLSLGERHPV